MASFFVSRQSKFSRLQLASLQRYQCVFPLYRHDNDFVTCQDNNYFQFYSALYDFCHAVTPCSFEKRTYVCHTLLVYCLLSFLEVTLFFVCFFLSMFFRASPPVHCISICSYYCFTLAVCSNEVMRQQVLLCDVFTHCSVLIILFKSQQFLLLTVLISLLWLVCQ